MDGRNQPGGARAFTLVELVTVMGILAILVALIVGAAQGVSDIAARKATDRILASLDAALQRYYDDWGKFPWYRTENDPELAELLGKVAGAGATAAERMVRPSYCPVPITGRYENEVEAMLYATLNMRERNGPYMHAGNENVRLLPYGITYKYRVYVDAWGRPIHCFPPQKDSSGNLQPVPLLMSEGRAKDFPDDTWDPNRSNSKADNLTNYDLRAMGVTRIDAADREY